MLSSTSIFGKSLFGYIIMVVATFSFAQDSTESGEAPIELKSVWDEATFFSRQLDNGLQVSIFSDQRLPIVATQLTYHVGSAHEAEDSRGLAHLFEHLMFGKTTNYPERAIFNYVEQFGGSTNAFTSFDETAYYALTPPKKHFQVLEIYADGMQNLNVTQEDLDRDIKIVLEELRLGAQNDPFNRLSIDVLAQGMNEHPYSISPLGTEADVSNATLEKCQEFYNEFYGPANAHLIIAGPVNVYETYEFIDSTFGNISKDVDRSSSVPLLSEWTFPQEVEAQEKIPPVEIAAQIYQLPTAEAEDTQAIHMLIRLLNGIDGYENEIVRNKRVALYAQTAQMNFKAGRILGFVSAALPYRKKEAAFRYIDETLTKLADFEWLTEETLAAVKRTTIMGEYQSRYYSDSIVGRIQSAHDWQKNVALAFDLEERISQVTVQDVKDAYTKYVLNGTPVRIYVEPTHVPWYVRAFGRLYPLAERVGLADLFL